ncbi:helix-turn-helix domain-containing protein [Streptomyces sp. TRM72054]|uniref:helix-turn-helix domain-containing protein n=1 Tax=Streptomyces sp. TRM72054 TaxID=2870562 RepID=UPI001C8BB3CE|nr:helix-turn-helix transcriptional regulator [Streptomyces sp. TRM72054]MBX9392296.1 helix-turn-helix domain-containing protein [Streptomyces sp. TRM72054]
MHQPEDDAWLNDHARVLGDRIRTERSRRKLTQEQLHLNAGISRDVLQRIEAGRHNPTFFTLLRIARVLDVPLADLVR